MNILSAQEKQREAYDRKHANPERQFPHAEVHGMHINIAVLEWSCVVADSDPV